MSKFAAECRKEGMKDTTLAHHLRHIKAATRWAVKLGLMAKAPSIEMPKRAKGQSQARSRAITTEEYERVLLAIPKARPTDAAQWNRYIEGLWLSGLRRSEALALTWDQDGVFCAHLGEKRPVFIIRSEGQKSGRAETCPMAPDFGAWLLAVPEAERTGPVFRLTGQGGLPMLGHRVGQIVERIGKAAKVKVGTRTKREKREDGETVTVTVPVFAGCHSYRRGFGSKWARRVAPSVLKRLMRHASIATTEGYYVHLDASDVADELWEKFGNLPAAPVPVADAGLQHSSNMPPVERVG
jgi:integrase